jgi:hypothetical protein
MSSRFAFAGLVLLTAAPAPAQVFTDGFEAYTGGGAPLDKNTAGPNAAPNGSGQPWFGPVPPNARVVGTEGTVTPHSGAQMIRGSLPSDLDQNWVNLAYRFNGGSPYTGGIALQFWFFDPLGPGNSNFRDYGALGFYNTAPSNTDYPGTGSLNTGVTQIQRLSLGASSVISGGYDPNVYQARVVGAADGYSSGWFNTTTPRSVGWHLAQILVGPALGDGTNDVSFYIDNLATPTLTHNSVTPFGYNVIELNTDFGPTTGYFDDISFSAVPEPSAPALAGLAAAGLAYRRYRRRRAVSAGGLGTP